MLIYHGSDVPVIEPKILVSNRLLDFGVGFYTTSSYEQAGRWAVHISNMRKSKSQIISFYDFDLDKAVKDLQIIQFDSPTPEWLYFVTACRSGRKSKNRYDIAMGPVANDNVYAIIQMYETGLLSEEETITRLKVEKIYNQILFHTEHALTYCTYTKHENIGETKQ